MEGLKHGGQERTGKLPGGWGKLVVGLLVMVLVLVEVVVLVGRGGGGRSGSSYHWLFT